MENDAIVKTRAWIGFDNGISGAWAVIDEHKIVHAVSKFDLKVVAKKDHIDSLALYEKLAPICAKMSVTAVAELPAMQQGPPGASRTNASAIMSTGISFGRIMSVLDLLRVPFIIKSPTQWMPEFWSAGSGDSKELSINMAMQLYPNIKPLITNNGKRKPDHNSTDAVLLAEYGRRKNL